MNASSKYWKLSALALLLALQTAPQSAWPHAGEDHTGAGLAANRGPALDEPIHVPKQTQFLLEILTARAVEESVPRRLKALGHVELPPERQAEVHAPFEGILVNPGSSALPAIGQRVKKNDPIAFVEQILAAPEALSLVTEAAKTESEMKQAQEELALQQQELERIQQLGEAASGKRLAEAQTELAVARQKVAGLQQTVREIRNVESTGKNNPRVAPIQAPIDGVIQSSHVTLGEFVEREKLLYHLSDHFRVLVEAEVYELDLPLVEDAGSAEIFSEAYPGERFSGKLNFVGQRMNPDTQTIQAVFDVDNPQGRLRENMFVNVYIDTKQRETGVMFPKAAVVNQGGQKVVFLKTGAETFIARPVEIVGTWDDRVMVGSGVKAGEIVVIQGMYQVRMSAK